MVQGDAIHGLTAVTNLRYLLDGDEKGSLDNPNHGCRLMTGAGYEISSGSGAQRI